MSGLVAYPEYLARETDWIGDIPLGWIVAPSKSLFKLRKENEREGDVHLTPSQKYGVMPQQDYMDLTGSKVVLTLVGSTKMKHVEVNDFIIHLRSFQGGIEWSGFSGKVSPAYTVLSPSQSADPRYFRYVLKCAGYIEKIASLTDQLRDGQSMNYLDFGKASLPCPPIQEQRAIAVFLDREIAEIDAFIADQEELVRLLTERRAAMITRAVTKGLDAEAPMHHSGVEWLGEVPQGWKVVPLRHLLASKLKYGANEPADHDDPQWVRYLRITDFDIDGKLKDETFRSLPPDVAAEYMVRPGDVLLARSGATVGKAFLVPAETPPSCFAGYLIRVDAARERMLPEFFFAYTQSSSFSGWKESTLIMATIQNIGADRYATLPVPVPPIEEQQRIIDFLNLETAEIDAAISEARTAIELSRERRSALIAAAVTGKIDVREPILAVAGA